MARGYTKRQTGTRSSWGGGGGSRRVLNPWGNLVGKTSQITTSKRRGAVSKPKPDISLFTMSYPKNDPLAWPIEGGKVGSLSGMNQAKADFHNDALNYAYKRAGYPEA